MFVMLRILIQPVVHALSSSPNEPPMSFVVPMASVMLAQLTDNRLPQLRHLVSFRINSGLSSTVLQSIERLRSFS
ncbi:hypothetical protein BCR34DRAFT_581603, partial [Clohesyomyces aquaticus]